MSTQKVLEAIENCNDIKKLQNWIYNAKKTNNSEIATAAFNRLVKVAPNINNELDKVYNENSVEYDFWKTIHAFEQILKEEKGKTILLARTRQKVKKIGEIAIIKEWSSSPEQSDGFKMLVERNRPDLLGEAIAIRHPNIFSEEIINLAKAKLEAAGINLNNLQ